MNRHRARRAGVPMQGKTSAVFSLPPIRVVCAGVSTVIGSRRDTHNLGCLRVYKFSAIWAPRKNCQLVVRIYGDLWPNQLCRNRCSELRQARQIEATDWIVGILRVCSLHGRQCVRQTLCRFLPSTDETTGCAGHRSLKKTTVRFSLVFKRE